MAGAKRGDCKLEDSGYDAAMFDNFDPNSIEDHAIRQVVFFLINQVEELAARVKSQVEEASLMGCVNSQFAVN